jgi:glutaredoxin
VAGLAGVNVNDTSRDPKPAEGALQLYGSMSCPYTTELREHLAWQGLSFEEYDVETDADARDRLRRLIGDRLAVPVLVKDGRVKEIGWRGRNCIL